MELFRSCGIIVPSSYFYNFYHKEYLIVPVEVYMVVINVILSFAVCLFVCFEPWNSPPWFMFAGVRLRLPMAVWPTTPTLSETRSMPCASGFAECLKSGTRQRCRLSSASQKALGKLHAHDVSLICRVPTLAKKGHMAYPIFAKCPRACTRQRQRTCPPCALTM